MTLQAEPRFGQALQALLASKGIQARGFSLPVAAEAPYRLRHIGSSEEESAQMLKVSPTESIVPQFRSASRRFLA